jgi:hypothetical protein
MFSGDVALFPVGTLLRDIGALAYLPEDLRENIEEKIGTWRAPQ